MKITGMPESMKTTGSFAAVSNEDFTFKLTLREKVLLAVTQ
ncbi:hypothetical protein [Psychromonas sp.]